MPSDFTLPAEENVHPDPRTMPAPPARRPMEPDMAPESFRRIAAILREQFGLVLESYKDKCVKRRINIRIRATQSPSAERYCELLAQSPAEQERLLEVLTIHVSQFFRNPSAFARLGGEIIPQLLSGRPHGEPLTFWSVGCAGGEEPYTLALIMKEQFAAELAGRSFRIVATDLDQRILEAAQAGLYGVERIAEVSPAQLKRWFTPLGERYLLSPEIRSLVSFEQGDLSQPGCAQESDLILCRNVLIYFERQRQEEIQCGFADSLRPGGFLVLGKSETLVGEARTRFHTVCPVERIYRLR